MDAWAEKSARWSPPAEWRRLRVVDAHTAGEPLRVILDGFPRLDGATVPARRADARTRHDALRRALMWEPRGHADMYGCLVGPPATPHADFSVLFMHNEGFSTMCGHGTIGVVTVVLELGLVPHEGEEARLGIDTPAGLVEAHARVEDGRVRSVSFVNVPSFVVTRDREVDVPGVGPVRYDVAFGGAFYAFVEAEDLGLRLVPGELARLISVGRDVKRAAVAAGEPPHPDHPDLGFLYGTIFVGPAHGAGAHSRNVCVFADGEVDRSPTGTGVSARLALHHARGELSEGEEIRVESILGTTFGGRVVRKARVGPHDAVIPEVTGSAWITGRGELLVAPDDPLGDGFLLR
jgi:trans-L-3-hydroxyproline dehydratase